MFRALTCPSSGGKIVFTQHLVSSLSVNVCTIHRLRADCRCCVNTIFPPEDGHVNARKNVEDNSVTNILLMNKENCVLKLVDKIIVYYDARSKNIKKHQILYLNIFRKSVENVRVSLKYDKNVGYLMWRTVYICDIIALISS